MQELLSQLIAPIQQKSKQINQLTWILETTGSQDAAILKAEVKTELRVYCGNRENFEKLLVLDNDLQIKDPVVKRQLNVLIRMCKPCLLSKQQLEKIAQAEAHLSLLYANFRASHHGHDLSENEMREVLKKESNVHVRKDTWEASKQIGKVLAPHIVQLVRLRNQAANELGYANYFSMQLQLQEVDEQWLFTTLDHVAAQSHSAYAHVMEEINESLANKWQVPRQELGPWAWSEPFCQEDPLDVQELDALVKEVDIVKAAEKYYRALGFDVSEILKRSDNFERVGKNQQAFCLHIDRNGDIRTLNNVRQTIKWLEILLHELGHAVYEQGYCPTLPWLLKEPPHMITTEAMALLAGRQAFRPTSLNAMLVKKEGISDKLEASLRRRQLIFSRWVLLMTYFERELYRDPSQNLQALWWQLVWKFQKITCLGSKSGCDWAAKYHIGLAPVYYFSYLLGEFFASSLEKKITPFSSTDTSTFLNEKLFKKGNALPWDALVTHAIGKDLSGEDWLSQFAASTN